MKDENILNEKHNSNSSSDSYSIERSNSFPDQNKFSDYDYLIQAEYDNINETEGKLYKNDFTKEDKKILNNIKNDKVEKRHFKKWYKMSYSSEQIKILSNIPSNEISKSINNLHKLYQKNLNSKFYHSISQSENGLRNYYSKNKKHFKSRVIKGPPNPFRNLSYVTLSNIPIDRVSNFYYEILKNNLENDIENQINNDLPRTLIESKIEYENVITNIEEEEEEDKENNILKNMEKPLLRILKVIALIDKELSYCQGMNFIVGFLLFITNGNEIDSFYLMIALLSKTYNKKYGIRGFFTNKFPLLQLYIWIFHLEFSKKFNKIYNLFLKLQIPDECWISKWLQTLFVHNIPYCNLVRLWDFIFTHGIKGLISICLSLIDYFEKDFEKVKDETEVTDIFKRIRKDSNFVDIKKIIELSTQKYYIKEKQLSKYKKEYIIEKKIEIKPSIFDDIKYDMDIITNYIIGSNLDFINNKFEEEIDFEKCSKKLNKCKKLSSNIKYDKNNKNHDDEFIVKESLLEHNIPYSDNHNNYFNFQNPFSSISHK